MIAKITSKYFDYDLPTLYLSKFDLDQPGETSVLGQHENSRKGGIAISITLILIDDTSFI